MFSVQPYSTGSIDFRITPLTEEIFEKALVLWGSSEGVVLRSEDHDLIAIARFLFRNPLLNWGAWHGDALIGAVMAGHDGRRGYVYHLAVAADFRRCGIGRSLVANVEQGLAEIGIPKAHAYVVHRNLRAQLFWTKLGWSERDDLATFSRHIIQG